MKDDEKLESYSVDPKLFGDLKSSKSNSFLLSEYKDDQLVYKKLIKIIKQYGHHEEIKNIAERVFSIIKSMTRIIRWENFSNICLKDCILSGISFVDCNFSHSILDNVNIDSCWFIGCCLDKVRWANIICSEQRILKFQDSIKIKQMILSPDGTSIICHLQNSKCQKLQIYNFNSGQLLKSLRINGDIDQIIFINQKNIAFVINNSIYFQNIYKEKCINHKFSRQIINLHSSGNGTIIFEGKKKLYFYNGFNFKSMRKILLNLNQFNTKLSNNGQYISFNLDVIEFWDLTKGKNLQLSQGNASQVQALYYYLNTKQLIAIRKINKKSIIQLWNMKELYLNKSIELIQEKLEELDYQHYSQGQMISSEGQMLLIFMDGSIRLYNIKTDQFTQSCIWNRQIRNIFFHQNKQLMILSEKNKVYYLDPMANQTEIINQSYSSDTQQLNISYNGEYAAMINSNNQINILKTANWEKLTPFNQTDVTAIQFSPVSNIIAFGKCDSSISFYDVKEEKLLMKTKAVTDYGQIKQIVFSPDGQIFAFLESKIIQIVFMNSETGNLLFTLKGHQKPITKILFSPNGLMLASASTDETIRLWNLSQPGCFNLLENQYWFHFLFSPDSKYFVQLNQQISFFDISLNKYVKKISNSRQYTFIQYNSTGTLLLCCSQDVIDVFEVQTEDIIQSQQNNIILWDLYCEKVESTLQNFHDHSIKYLASSQSNQILISGLQNGSVILSDYTGKEKLKAILNVSNQKIKISQSGKFLAFVVQDLVIHLINLGTEIEFKIMAQKDKILAIDISKNDQLILSCEVSIIFIWDVTSRQILKTIDHNFHQVNNIFFASNNQQIFVSTSQEIIQVIDLWEQVKQEILFKCLGVVTTFKISPDGKKMVIGNLDGKIQIFDIQMKKITKEMYEHEGEIIDIEFSFDNSFFASASKDETICLWKTKFGTIYEKIMSVEGLSSITFMMNETLAYGCNNGNIKTIKFLDHKIRPLNQYSNYFKATKQYNTSFEDAEIISTHSFNLIDVLQNSL